MRDHAFLAGHRGDPVERGAEQLALDLELFPCEREQTAPLVVIWVIAIVMVGALSWYAFRK